MKQEIEAIAARKQKTWKLEPEQTTILRNFIKISTGYLSFYFWNSYSHTLHLILNNCLYWNFIHKAYILGYIQYLHILLDPKRSSFASVHDIISDVHAALNYYKLKGKLLTDSRVMKAGSCGVATTSYTGMWYWPWLLHMYMHLTF